MATNWDATKPAGTTKIRLSDEQLRSNFAAIETAFGQEHEFPVTEATDGLHKQITFSKQIADPTPGANTGAVYISDITASAELMWQDENGNSCQITSGGSLSFVPAGTKMLFYQDTAPTGWTIDATVDDKLIFVSKGSGAGGETGGGAHSTGTWTQLNHLHAVYKENSAAGNLHGGKFYDSAGTLTEMTTYNTVTNRHICLELSTGGNVDDDLYTSLAAPANTWRPAAYVVIIATKD